MIQEEIQNLLNLLANELDEKELVKDANDIIKSLREQWKIKKELFAEYDIANLKIASEQIKSIEIFIEEMEEFEFIDSSDEVDEVIGKLYPVVESTSKLKISERVKKEIRELLTRRSSLKSTTSKNKSNALRNGINALNTNKPKCKKCGAGMVLREGNGTFFWGCPTFPKCWGRKWLTKDELNKLA
jgi:hypothetical protein